MRWPLCDSTSRCPAGSTADSAVEPWLYFSCSAYSIFSSSSDLVHDCDKTCQHIISKIAQKNVHWEYIPGPCTELWLRQRSPSKIAANSRRDDPRFRRIRRAAPALQAPRVAGFVFSCFFFLKPAGLPARRTLSGEVNIPSSIIVYDIGNSLVRDSTRVFENERVLIQEHILDSN